jgi:hypothetical protein
MSVSGLRWFFGILFLCLWLWAFAIYELVEAL